MSGFGATNRLSDRLRVQSATFTFRAAPPGVPLEGFERRMHLDDASLAREAAEALEAAQRVVEWARAMSRSGGLAEDLGSEMAARIETLEALLAKEVWPRHIPRPRKARRP